MKVKHVCISIDWFIRNLNAEYKSYSWKNKHCKDCFWMTYWETMNELNLMKIKWMDFIPSDTCKNVNPNWTCWC